MDSDAPNRLEARLPHKRVWLDHLAPGSTAANLWNIEGATKQVIDSLRKRYSLTVVGAARAQLLMLPDEAPDAWQINVQAFAVPLGQDDDPGLPHATPAEATWIAYEGRPDQLVLVAVAGEWDGYEPIQHPALEAAQQAGIDAWVAIVNVDYVRLTSEPTPDAPAQWGNFPIRWQQVAKPAPRQSMGAVMGRR